VTNCTPRKSWTRGFSRYATRMDALLPERGRVVREGRSGSDPSAPVQQGGVVAFTRPESSYEELERLTRNACRHPERLGLHHRVVTLCTGDMGFSARRRTTSRWAPRSAHLRISSCSIGAFQRAARRFASSAREGKDRVVHTPTVRPRRGAHLNRDPRKLSASRGSVRRPEACARIWTAPISIDRE